MSAMPMPFMPGRPGNQFDTFANAGGFSLPSYGAAPVMAQPTPDLYRNSMDMQSDLFSNGGMPNAGGFSLPGYAGGTGAATGGGGIMDWMFGKGTKDSPGNIGGVLGAANSLATGFMAMKQYGLAKDTLAQNKKQFETQFAAQKGLTNASLEDRQRARVASSPGAYQSVGDYMAKNGVQ